MNTLLELGGNCKISSIYGDEIEGRRKELEEMLAPAFACAHGELGPKEALDLCVAGKASCFIGEINKKLTALLIAEFMDFPLLRVLNILAYAGKARGFYQLLHLLETWGKLNGATEIRGYGGEAQMRLARQVHGFKEIYRVYARPILGD